MKHILNVITPNPDVSLLSLEEAKILLNIPATDTSQDAALQLIVNNVSDAMAVSVNRTFVYEKVHETFFDITNSESSIYFSRWPVKVDDILELTADGVDLLPSLWPQPLPPDAPPTAPAVSTGDNWTLEEKTGTLYRPPSGMWVGNVSAIYSGGYKLPDEAPPALKQVAAMLAREGYYEMLRGAIMSGIRMLSHKHARVMYYPQGPQALSSKSLGSTPATQRAASDVLSHYIRYWL